MTQPVPKKRKTDSHVGSSISDPRFANIQSDPRYRLPGKKQKIKLDKRFSRALRDDDDFSRRAKVDRYGRLLETDSEKKRLKRKYEFEEDDSPSDQSDGADDDDEVQRELARVDSSRDVLREGKASSSSETESSSDEDSDVEDDFTENTAGPGLQKPDVPTGEVTSRLAVVNLDWDNIRAEDLMAVFNSFLPSTGRLLKVAVYPSEFGRERMEREEMEGPPKEIFADVGNVSGSEDDDEDIKNNLIKPDDGSEFDSSALRQYQLDRLRYFYAVLTFSSSDAAKIVYDKVDGTEYLSTANFFDLRFVPDDTDFAADTPREECERIPPGYKPNEFATDALQHSKVKLTWDAEDGSRKEAQARAFRGSRQDIDENDLKAYLGSDSEDTSEEDTQDIAQDKLSKKDLERQRMRALLGLSAEPKKKNPAQKDLPSGNIQITFSSGLTGAADDQVSSSDGEDTGKRPKKGKRSVFANSPEPEETTMEKYIRKEKERKQRRKEKMKQSGANPTAEDAVPDDSDVQVVPADATASDLGFDDPFFAEADSRDVKSASKLRKEERLKKRREREAEEAANAKSRAELELLMADDNKSEAGPNKVSKTVKHFDMKEIEKAEKAAKKKNKTKFGKKGKADESGNAVTAGAGDDFSIDTKDPRFARLFENHEFAIDPSNPRFKGTKGMTALLEEGRSRRVKGEDYNEISIKKKDQQSTSSQAVDANGNGSDVMALVGKIKKKSKK